MSMADVTLHATAPGTVAAQEHHSYVDWPAIVAGIALASAISLVLLTFGSAIGLSFANFRSFDGVAPLWVAIAAATWLLWVEVSSFMAGAYLTGRLRRRFADATEHEVAVRDGAHGLIVWAGGLVIGAIIAVGGIGAVASAIGSAAATITTAASNIADESGVTLDPNAYYADMLFRLPPGTTPAAGTLSDFRGEAMRILAEGATQGSVSDGDRSYLAQIVASETGLTPEQAQTRVTEVSTAIDAAKAKAAEIAEAARKTAVLAAFLTAASFLVAAAGAYWSASMGGRHRDDGTVFADIFRRY
jgi:hypothetical protein